MGKLALFYDFETMSQDPETAPVVSIAAGVYDMIQMEAASYSYESVLNKTRFMKFDVREQVEEYGRVIDPETIKWWSEQSKEAQETLKPLPTDKNIEELIPFLKDLIADKNIDYVFTRNNTFDPVIVQSIVRVTKQKIPYPWWAIRDVKSFIFGLTYGHNIKDSFIPPDVEGLYVKHDPRHDIALDVMRLQTILHAKSDCSQEDPD